MSFHPTIVFEMGNMKCFPIKQYILLKVEISVYFALFSDSHSFSCVVHPGKTFTCIQTLKQDISYWFPALFQIISLSWQICLRMINILQQFSVRLWFNKKKSQHWFVESASNFTDVHMLTFMFRYSWVLKW